MKSKIKSFFVKLMTAFVVLQPVTLMASHVNDVTPSSQVQPSQTLEGADLDHQKKSQRNLQEYAAIQTQRILTFPLKAPVPRINTELEYQFRLAEMCLWGQGGPRDYASARSRFTDVLNSLSASKELKLFAEYYLAGMDYAGLDGPKNYKSARLGFQKVLSASSLLPSDKRIDVQYTLAEMCFLGVGGDRDYKAAREGFHNILMASVASEKRKSLSRFRLADMDFHGMGLDAPDYVSAYENLQALIMSPHATVSEKSAAIYNLSFINLRGLGRPRDLKSAEDGFKRLLRDTGVTVALRLKSALSLGLIDLQNGKYDAARVRFRFVWDSDKASDALKIDAKVKLAYMDQRGLGLSNPDDRAAQNHLEEILKIPGLPQYKQFCVRWILDGMGSSEESPFSLFEKSESKSWVDAGISGSPYGWIAADIELERMGFDPVTTWAYKDAELETIDATPCDQTWLDFLDNLPNRPSPIETREYHKTDEEEPPLKKRRMNAE